MVTHTTNFHPHYDLASAVRVAQVLSAELDYDQLIKTILHTFLEHTGAQRGWIYLPRGGQWQAAAGGTAQAGSIQVFFPVQPDPPLHAAVIERLLDQNKPLLVQDGGVILVLNQGAQISMAGARCSFYFPMLHQGELTAILSLEHISDSLTPECLEMCLLLATQSAISLSNLSMMAELRVAEEAARANELRFRHLYENTPVGIFEIDISDVAPVIRAANRRAESLYGWTEQEYLQVDPEHLFLPGAGWEFWRLVSAVIRGETATVETMTLRRDGTSFPTRVIATPEHGPHANHLVLTVEDITAVKQRKSEAEAVDEERRRMAQEIHDGVAQDLAALRLKISVWHEWVDNCPGKMHSELDQLQQTLDDSIEEIRRSIYALRPVALDEVGFFAAVHKYLKDVRSQFPLYIDMSIDGPIEYFPQELELPIFRVLQEAINNIIKHAGASLVRIVLDLSDNTNVSLSIQDNGRGFNLGEREEALRTGHLGLKQMQERVEKAHGSFKVDSQLGHGTVIRICIPIEST